jgi:flagellar assembly protein FliH
MSDEKRKLFISPADTITNRNNEALEDNSVVIPHEQQLGVDAHADSQKINVLVEQAKQSVLNQFKEEAETARELGRQRGLREGHLAGLEEARKSFSIEFERIQLVAKKLEGALDHSRSGVEDAAVVIAFEAVCKILGSTILTMDGVRNVVQNAMANLNNTEPITIRLQQEDLDLLAQNGKQFGVWPIGNKITWVADDRITAGCVVESSAGDLDARLETQVERLREVLLQARQRKRE